MSYIIKAHNAIPLERLTDEELRWYCAREYWTLVEAPFILTGHKPPIDNSTHHFLDHSDVFPYEFREALTRSVEAGTLCQRMDRADQRRWGDTPANWFPWAAGLEPEHFIIDRRVKRLLSSGEQRVEPGPSSPAPDPITESETETAEGIEPDANSELDGSKPQSPKPGRPSRHDEIVTAYEKLRGADKINWTNKASNYPAIREQITGTAHEDPPPKGLGNEAIRKAIGPIFDADKAEAD